MIAFFKQLNLIFDRTIEQEAGEILIKSGKTLATAESCTGGLVSSLMTDVSGSSAYVKANFVTYANEAKVKYLNVSETTLQNFGAVSNQTASEMTMGLLENTNCDYALVTTGIAGPTGGSDEKPVGLVYIGVGSKNNVQVFKFNVNPKYPRPLIKYMFAKHAIKLLTDFLKENEQ